METMETALVAILGTLIAALIWVVKALMSQIVHALGKLGDAVDAFHRVEEREDAVHAALLDRIEALSSEHEAITSRLEAIATVQKQTLQMIETRMK